MTRLISLLITLLCAMPPAVVFASSETFVREYTYVASDLDSKVTARKNALKLIKAGVLEEIVSYTTNTSLLKQSQLGDTFEKSFIQSASTMSAGFMRVKVLDEEWDGFKMWVKAEVRANPVRVRKQLEDAIAATRHVKQAYQPGTVPAPVAVAAPTQTDTGPATSNNINSSNVAQVVNSTLNQNTADYSGYVRAAKFSQIMSLLTPVRMRVIEYYQMNGDWPDEMKNIQLKAAEMNDGQSIESVKLGKDGKIFAFLNPGFGSDRLVTLSPKSIMGGTNMRWECSSNLPLGSYANVSHFQCKQDTALRFDGKTSQ